MTPPDLHEPQPENTQFKAPSPGQNMRIPHPAAQGTTNPQLHTNLISLGQRTRP